jgi:hypothetical protein
MFNKKKKSYTHLKKGGQREGNIELRKWTRPLRFFVTCPKNSRQTHDLGGRGVPCEMAENI